MYVYIYRGLPGPSVYCADVLTDAALSVDYISCMFCVMMDKLCLRVLAALLSKCIEYVTIRI